MAPPQTRREALGLLGSMTLFGAAGCLTTGQGFGDTGGTSRQTEPSTSTELEDKLSFSATALQSFTDEHPGRINIALLNDREKQLMMGVSRGIKGPFSTLRGEQGEDGGELVILGDNPDQPHETPPGAPCSSEKYAIPESPMEGCWKPACEIPMVHMHASVSIAPQETLEWKYVVLDGFNDTCLPAGTYEFEETVPIAYLQTGDSLDSTPSGGWSHLLTKRVWLTLESDGTLTADSGLELEARGSDTVGSSPNATPVSVSEN